MGWFAQIGSPVNGKFEEEFVVGLGVFRLFLGGGGGLWSESKHIFNLGKLLHSKIPKGTFFSCANQVGKNH